jgi:homodimeric-type pyruvate dehydrogenase E1 component
VRGNGKIVQELEANFRGAGWNVIKVLWGTGWDELIARDFTGRLRQLMEECLDGDYQDFKSKDGAYVRKNFFGRYPETAAMVAGWSDDKIWALTRGGHDPRKVYAAYKAAVETKAKPTVILAKTVKGYGMGSAGEGQMITHQAKKMALEALKQFRDRFRIPISDEDLPKLPFLKFEEGSEELAYLRERREALGGYLPTRRAKSDVTLQVPPLSAFKPLLEAGGEGREFSTTMAFVRVQNTLLRDKSLGKGIVPIVPDESRTFGMEGMFRQYGIFSQVGQLYRPQDADQLMFYKEDKSGQMLQEGINEAGAMSSWIAAATSHSTSNCHRYRAIRTLLFLAHVRDLPGTRRAQSQRAFRAADTHPLITPRIRKYLTTEGKFDDVAWRAWQIHWFTTGLEALERRLAVGKTTGAFAHGDSVTIADICLASIIVVARVFKIEVPNTPTINRIMATCEQLKAFQRAEPSRQFGAPATL